VQVRAEQGVVQHGALKEPQLRRGPHQGKQVRRHAWQSARQLAAPALRPWACPASS